MDQLFYAVAILACPVGMGVMMMVMMRRPNQPLPVPAADDDELARLRAEIDQLKAARRYGADLT